VLSGTICASAGKEADKQQRMLPFRKLIPNDSINFFDSIDGHLADGMGAILWYRYCLVNFLRIDVKPIKNLVFQKIEIPTI
jgi:hypothetical protein